MPNMLLSGNFLVNAGKKIKDVMPMPLENSGPGKTATYNKATYMDHLKAPKRNST